METSVAAATKHAQTNASEGERTTHKSQVIREVKFGRCEEKNHNEKTTRGIRFLVRVLMGLDTTIHIQLSWQLYKHTEPYHTESDSKSTTFNSLKHSESNRFKC